MRSRTSGDFQRVEKTSFCVGEAPNSLALAAAGGLPGVPPSNRNTDPPLITVMDARSI